MVLTALPPWADEWMAGKGPPRVSQDDRHAALLTHAMGQYGNVSDPLGLMLYSGPVALPPQLHYMRLFERVSGPCWAGGESGLCLLRPSPSKVQGAKPAPCAAWVIGAYTSMRSPHLLFVPPSNSQTKVLKERPLQAPHDGTRDMDEQGVVAAAFSRLAPRPVPIPLFEFPFCRAFENFTDFGVQGDRGKAWGYHFGRSFALHNPHFDSLSRAGRVINATTATAAAATAAAATAVDAANTTGGAAVAGPAEAVVAAAVASTRWLGSSGQWGTPGWGLSDAFVAAVLREVLAHGKCNSLNILDIATSRGRVAAALARAGCHHVTTVDRVDRGAATNLAGLEARVVLGDADDFLATHPAAFDVIVIDFHGNGPKIWSRRGPLVEAALAPGGLALVGNARLHLVQGWEEERGVSEWLDRLPAEWALRLAVAPPPGLAVFQKPLGHGTAAWRRV
jgi:hypothetical protein